MTSYDVRMQYRDAVGIHNVTIRVEADTELAAGFKAQTELNRTRGVFLPDSIKITELTD